MNETDFLDNYLWPSDDRLNTQFIHPLPNIAGIRKSGDFIVQSELEETFATTKMTKYESDTLGVRLVDVYRNTQHKSTGIFVRLVGTISLAKTGYPRLSLDAGVSNVNLLTAEREDLTTRVRISLPQAETEQGELFFNSLGKQAKEAGISFNVIQFDALPDFYGPIWLAESKGVNLDLIRQLRDYVWISYKHVIEQTKEKMPFDYRPLQEHMIFNSSRREQLLFKGVGLSVPVEAYAALFSVMGPAA